MRATTRRLTIRRLGSGEAVQVGGPQDRLATVDKEPARRRPVLHDPVGPHAEHTVRELLIGRDPALPVTPPTKLREHRVEPLPRHRQHHPV
jgi:hypothetical protein